MQLEDIKRANNILKCPHCGAEYLACEIFVPKQIFGKPSDLIKDALGKILYVDYVADQEPELTEHYKCDYCDTSFAVDFSYTCKTKKEIEELDFKNQAVSLLN